MVGQCGNGIVDGMEHCDDNNTVDNDGCNSTCHVEDHFVCTNMTNTISDCVAILLDLNVTDETSLDREDIEYFDTNEPVFLVEPTTLDFFVRREAVSIDTLSHAYNYSCICMVMPFGYMLVNIHVHHY